MDLSNLAFLGILLLFYFLGFARLPHRVLPLGVYLALLALVLAAAWLREARGATGSTPFLLMAYPVAFLFTAFESMSLTLPHVNPLRFDGALARIDLALTGVDPTVWMERFAAPWLTDLLSLAYAFYFPMPLILLGWMLARKRFAQTGDAIFRYLVCYYGAYVGYFIVPAEGPRFFLAGEHQGPLSGLLLTDPIRRLIDVLEPNKLDAFPSLHAAILVVTLLLAYRENRPMFSWFLPCGAAIFLSLVYLRYHYLVDVIAGVAWAFLSDRVAGVLATRFAPRFVPHFGATG